MVKLTWHGQAQRHVARALSQLCLEPHATWPRANRVLNLKLRGPAR